MKQTFNVAGAFVFSLFVSLSDSRAQYDPLQWPTITLRFSEAGTLKDVFDSGLKPYHFPTLERFLLEAKHARLTVLQRNGQSLPEFPAARITIKPLQGGLLSSLEMTRYKTTIEESRALILPYLPKGGRNAQDLDRYLAAVKADYLDYNGMGKGVEDFAVQWSESGGPRYAVCFRKAFDPTRPLIMFISINWSQVRTPRQSRSFYKEPIPPPPGYENESMQAPKKFGPDSQADILVSQGIPITGDRPAPESPPSETSASAPPIPAATPARSSPTLGLAKNPTLVFERKPPVWPWVAGILALFGIVAFALKRRA